MNRTKTVYISIPIRGCEQWSFSEAHKAQLHYEKLGFNVYNPNELLNDFRKMFIHEPTEFQELTFTLEYLSKSDIMVLFPEHPRSFRCTTEIAMAYKFNIPIIQVYTGGTVPVKTMHADLIKGLLDPAELFLFSKFKVN